MNHAYVKIVCKIIYVLVLFLPIATCLYEGDVCKSYNGNPGICISGSKCQFAIDRLRYDGVRPILCSFNDREPIVCCPTGVINVQNQGTETKVLIIEKISQIKCREYSNCTTLLQKNRFVRHLSNSIEMSEYPHMVAIGWPLINRPGYLWSCEGSLVSENFVLTAAHCTSLQDSRLSSRRPTVVRMGDVNLTSAIRGHYKDVAISQIINHPQYEPPIRYHDIALLKLEKAIERNIFINPLCLWSHPFIGNKNATVSGWGRIDFLEGSSSSLRKATVPVIDNPQCIRQYQYPIQPFPQGIIASQICAGYSVGSTYSCQGDTGGPLQIADPHQNCAHHLIGVTSFGGGCAGENSPPVYTRISSYIDWIESIVWPQNV